MTAVLLAPVEAVPCRHGGVRLPSKKAAIAHVIARRTRAGMSGGPKPLLDIGRCRKPKSDVMPWHVCTIPPSDPRRVLLGAVQQLDPRLTVDIDSTADAEGPCTIASDEVCGVGQVRIRWSMRDEASGREAWACLACTVPLLVDAMRDAAFEDGDVRIVRAVDLATVSAR